MPNKYKLIVGLDSAEASQLTYGEVINVVRDSNSDEVNISIQIESIETVPSGFRILAEDFFKLLECFIYPLKDFQSRKNLASIGLIYAFLSPSGMSSFFIRGWRLILIRRMLLIPPSLGIAPKVDSLIKIGDYVKEGIKLVLAKFFYDMPKLLVLAAIGYSHFELMFDWTSYLITNFFKGYDYESASNLLNASSLKMTKSLATQLIFVLIYSLVVTPAFKILEIKYSIGEIKYKDFFSIKELIKSFMLYRKYKFSTVQMYLWDILLSLLSIVAGLFITITFSMLVLFVYPFYKLLFNHWPKSYGYGLLARRMRANGDL